MYINIKDKKEYTADYIKFLGKRMRNVGLDYLNKYRRKLIPINKYLKEQVFLGIRKPTAEQIIVAGLNNFKFDKTNSFLVISINESIKVPLESSMLLETACNLINYGNVDLTPFPIFSYVFDYVKNNLVQIYRDYSFGVPA